MNSWLYIFRIGFCLVLICTAQATSKAQERLSYVTHLDIKDGLSSRLASSILQTPNGIIWVGTNESIDRYDGKNFKAYNFELNDLDFGRAGDMLEDSEGYFWLFDSRKFAVSHRIDGIAFFHPSSEKFYSIEERFGDRIPFQPDDLDLYFKQSDNTLFFWTKNQELWKYRVETGFQVLALPPNFYPYDFSDDFGFTGIIGNEVVRVTTEGEITFRHEIELAESVLNINVDSRGRIWYRYIPSEFKIVVLDPANKESVELNLPQTRRMVSYSELSPITNDYWFINGRQITVFDEDLNMIHHISNEEIDVIKHSVFNLYFDKLGLAWLGTADGVYQIELSPKNFKKYWHVNPLLETINNYASVRGVLRDENHLLIGSNRGVMNIDVNTDHHEMVDLIDDKAQRFAFKKGKDGKIRSIRSGLSIVDPERNVESDYVGGILSAWSMYEDDKGMWWVGDRNGVYYYNPNVTDSLVHFQNYNEFDEFGGVVYYIFQEDEHLFFCTEKGIYEMEKGKGLIGRYHKNGVGQYKLPTSEFYHAYKDKQNIYWLASAKSGLIRWDKKNQSTTTFTQKDGLPTSTLYAVYEDDYNNLWISSDNGIIRFNKTSLTSRVYSLGDGITNVEFNRVAHFKHNDGTIYFGGLNGVTAFHPKDFIEKTITIPQFSILEITKYRPDISKHIDIKKEAEKRKRINLHPGDRMLQIKFSFPDFFSSSRIKYYYNLTKDENGWIELPWNLLQISNLEYGRHTIRIKAEEMYGKYEPQIIEIPVFVHMPLTQRWYVRLPIALVVMLLIWAFVKYRIHSLEKRKAELENTVKERTRKINADKKIIEEQAKELQEINEFKSKFFANISHELRTPLTLILGPAKSILDKDKLDNEDKGYLKMMYSSAQGLLKLINQILNLSKHESKKLELEDEPVEFGQLIHRIVGSFESHASQHSIVLTMKYAVVQPLWLSLDSEKFEQILNNFLSNAIRHSNNGDRIFVEVVDNETEIKIKVKDTGAGIHEKDLPLIFDRYYQARYGDRSAKGGTGIGLAFSKDLAELFSGSIWVESELGIGSTFYFKFPKKEIAAPELTKAIESIPSYKLQTTVEERPIDTDKDTILLVEDNPNLREYITSVLSDFNVITAENGLKGLNALADENQSSGIKLIISDVMMPQMNGFEFLDRIKKDETYNKLPVIMLTARTNIHDKLNALRVGVDDYMVKPFNAEELVIKVTNLLSRYHKKIETAAEVKEVTEVVNASAQKWLKELEAIITRELNNSFFSLDWLASEVNISKRQLQRKIKSYTGITANQYVREVRLHKARLLLESGEVVTVSEVSYAVGFEDQHYFSSLYQKRYGKKPIEYLQSA